MNIDHEPGHALSIGVPAAALSCKAEQVRLGVNQSECWELLSCSENSATLIWENGVNLYWTWDGLDPYPPAVTTIIYTMVIHNQAIL